MSEYIGNTRTKEVHILECAWAHMIKEDDLIIFYSLEEAFADKRYEPCGHCLAGINICNSEKVNEDNIGQNIELIAYYNWINRGRPMGDPLTDWVKAESYNN